ncbi:ATP-binding protein [Streptomyces sp. Tu10]|uniref:ATP-binding protein n=1 Tax=Streptomyces sp. Tu10 TaxID=2838018 RepID=UPI001BDBB6FC|nr:ATP-binding protein [Streptomyces sp. Tu10]MBT1098705.1 ATP-binding protein [Streptomyces sp. Tu10]
MAETDGFVREPHGPDPDEDGAPMGGDHRIDIAGDASGTVIAGNHNVVIDAHGSTVNLLPPQERPRPVRRERVALVPRRQREPVGREADLEELENALRGHGVVQLWGPPGVGKSTLLRHAARSLEPGPDGVLFLNGAHREPEDLAQEIFEACYEAPGYAPTGPELRRLMTGIEVTVYVDDAELTPERLRLLADAAPDATFVFASRERSLLGESADLELRGLGRAAGLGLLERELRHGMPEAQYAVAVELCEVALGRPLLLLRAAGLARLDTSGEIRLPRAAEIDGLLPLLFDRLDTASLKTLHLLATLRDAEVDPEHVGVLCDVPDPAAVCGRLAGLGLVTVTERGYRSVADVLPEVRRRFAEPVAVDRLCDHFARWAALATTTPAQVADHGRALEVVAEMAERRGRPDLAVRVARAVSPFLAESLRFGVWGRLLDQGQNAARQAGDTTAHAYFTHEKAIRCLMIGRRVVAAVLLAEAVVLWRQLGDNEGVDAALNAQQYTPPTPETPPLGESPAPGADPGGDLGGDPGPMTGPEPATTTPDPVMTGPGTGADPVGAPGPDPGADPGWDPGSMTGPGPGTTTPDPVTTGPGTGADPGYDPGTGFRHDPDAGFGHDPGGAAGYDPANAPGSDHGWGWADQGASAADPATATAPNAATHPGADFGAGQGADPWSAADPTSHVAAHSSGTAGTAGTGGAAGTAGAAGTGGAVAGGAVAATTTAALWASVVAVVLGAVAALVIGVVVYQQLSSGDPTHTSSTSTSDLSSSSPSAASDELAGVWRDGRGNVFLIVRSGDGAYEFKSQGTCGATSTVKVTGGSGQYSGTMPVWDESTCGKTFGDARLSIDVSSDGSSASVEVTAPSNGSWECRNCGSQTWARQA